MWKPDICVFHGGCDDGFAAAWAIWKRWGDDVVFVPGVYGKPISTVGMEDRNVLFVDFSAKRPEIEAMAQLAKSIVIIDHHKTAEAELEPFKITPFDGSVRVEDVDTILSRWALLKQQTGMAATPVVAWFDMKQSGAVMAWKFVYPDAIIPQFLRYIEDRDLWRFKFGDRTKQFSAALRTHPMDFKTWDGLIVNDFVLVDDGRAILRAHNANIEKMLAESYMIAVAGHHVPAVNASGLFASDIGNALLRKYPMAPFAATWHRSDNETIKVSLRSEDSRLDVSQIAVAHGGGGHRNAAGYSVSTGKIRY